MKNLYYTFLTLVILGNVHSQNSQLNRARSEYEQLYYVKSSDIFLKVAEKGFKSQELFEKLGNALYFNNKMEEANKWYGELLNLYAATVEPEYLYRYAMTFKFMGNYTEANAWLDKFEALKKEDLRIKSYKEGSFDFKKEDKDITLINLPVNTQYSDFGSSVHKNTLYYSSPSVKESAKEYSWNEQKFLDIFSVSIKEIKVGEILLGKPKGYFTDINSKFHESNITYFNDTLVYFTRNNYYNNKRHKDSKRTNQLTILKASVRDTVNIKPLPIAIDNKEYTIAHAVFNAQKSRMYFSSDLSGRGKSDLFYVALDKNGEITGIPVNLGVKINTEGKECFPYVSEEGDLYFSSDGHYGFGGLDIYRVALFDKKVNSAAAETIVVENLGKPFNSASDDFAFITLENGNLGFLSSNRKGGKGDDDIYFYSRKCSATLSGLVVDKQTQEIIPEATVNVFVDGVLTQSLTSDKLGQFTYPVECNSKYLFKGEKEKYLPDEKNLVTGTQSLSYDVKLELEQDIKPFRLGDDVNQILDLGIIYFDFDKDDIRPDAAVELQKVIEFLKTYPDFKITVNSHTDSRGSSAYNLKLSRRRNASTIKYIIEVGGIDPSRIDGNGYGESMLLNHCSDGVKCTDAEHQVNRRSEFIINKP
ncbi:OmpA family protein [Flavobacterium cyanobacteriorum]|nr:OmpA family protein [Flavobacterium cyanobacteriorum]